MPFKCERCGIEFPKNQGLQCHKKRKNPCKIIRDPTEEALEWIEGPKKIQNINKSLLTFDE